MLNIIKAEQLRDEYNEEYGENTFKIKRKLDGDFYIQFLHPRKKGVVLAESDDFDAKGNKKNESIEDFYRDHAGNDPESYDNY